MKEVKEKSMMIKRKSMTMKMMREEIEMIEKISMRGERKMKEEKG
jgi:hypothetical protein